MKEFDLTGYSVEVDNEAQAKRLQEYAFEQGFKWGGNKKEIKYLDRRFFAFISNEIYTKKMFYDDEHDTNLIQRHFKDIFTNYSPDVSKKVTDPIVQSVVNKYQTRSEVGIKKYNTTLEENTDGLEVFLNHLQEELMDATLYIEKLKKQVESLKNRL